MEPLVKILIITTSHATLGAGDPTGIWLEELTTPYYAFVDQGAQVTVASIDGGAIPIDPRSLRPIGENDASVERYLKDDSLQSKVNLTVRFTAEMAKDYDAVFLPGGHGTIWDYPESQALAETVVKYLNAGRVVTAVCHGPAGLVSARLANGKAAIAGRKVTGFTNSEERAAGLDDEVPFLLETRLRELGANYVRGPDFKPFAVRDGNLVTGQNPASAGEVAKLTLEAVQAARATAATE
jgi:putative intracellular protease/amidase